MSESQPSKSQEIAAGNTALRLRWLSSWRYFRAHPLQLVLGVLGVSVGVAAVVAVTAARQAVETSFSRNLQILEGTATHTVVSTQNVISLDDYYQLRRSLPNTPMAPLIRERARLQNQLQNRNTPDDSSRVTVLGIDVISEAAFSKDAAGVSSSLSLLPSSDEVDMAAWLGGEALALIPTALMANVDSGAQHLTLQWAGDSIPLNVAGRVNSDSGLSGDVIIVDIGVAARLFNRTGIDSLRVQLDSEQAQHLTANLPAGLELRAANADQSGLGAAFGLNLLAMGLLALLMGVLIVFSTFRLLLLQREPLTRLRHALGSSPASQATDALCEALLLGVIGTVVGLLAGLGLAYLVIGWIQQTLSDLWVSGFNSGIRITPMMLMLSVLAGIGGSLLAALPLVWRVYKTGYVSSQQTIKAHRWPIIVGILLLLCGAGLLLGNDQLLFALAGLFAVTMGYLLLSVPMLGALAGGLRRWFNWRHLLSVVAARRLQASLGHTGPALVALVLAVASIVGIGSMVNSFRLSVSDWMDTSLSADAYIGAEGQPLPESLLNDINRWPEVAAVGWLRTERIRLPDYTAEISVIELPEQGQQSYRMLSGKNIWQSSSNVLTSVMVGETLAARRGIETGQTIRFDIPTLQTSVDAMVTGVFQDYRAGPGRLVVLRSALSIPLPAPTGLGVYLQPESVDESLGRLRQKLEDLPDLPTTINWFPAKEIKSETLRIFDQTFLLTNALRWIVVLVALVGISGALLALQLERRSELQLLQRLGLSLKEQRRLMLYESGLLGVLAVLLALPLGGLLAWMLCEVINQRAFGWHIAVRLLPEHYLLAAAVGLLATLLAGVLCMRANRSESAAGNALLVTT